MIICKTLKNLVKLSLPPPCLQTTVNQYNKKFYVKLLPLVENFICCNFVPNLIQYQNYNKV